MNKNTFLSLASQALVSGCNFATTVIIGNACDAEGLGMYVLGFSILVFGIGIQSALVSIPFTVYYPTEPDSTKSDRAASSYANHFRLMAVLITVAVFAALGLWWMSYEVEAIFALSMTVAIPAATTRDFLRRIWFSKDKVARVVLLDGLVALIQIAILLWLWQTDRLSPALGLTTIAIACMAACLAMSAKSFQRGIRLLPSTIERFRTDVMKDWKFGKWLLVEQVFTIGSTYLLPWVLAFYLDTRSVGIFAACFSIAALSNPFLQGIGNYLLPLFAKHISERNSTQLTKDNRKFTVLTVVTMLLFFVACLVFGEAMLKLLFRREHYAGYGILVSVLAARSVLGSLGLTAHYYLIAREKPKISLLASVLAVLTILVSAAILIPVYGLYGAAISWLLGTSIESLVMIGGFLKLAPLEHKTEVQHG